jgi:muconolactone delta-isomerase
MLYYARYIERASSDPQEARAMAVIRNASLNWLAGVKDDPRIQYVFRGEDNRSTHYFIDADSHDSLHELLDHDPLSMHCQIEFDPLLTTLAMATLLETYLDTKVLTGDDRRELEFPKKEILPNETYFLAIKVVAPFSPLLNQATQDAIHYNTLISQTTHKDEREIADFNPVAKPVGILIMQAKSKQEVLEHVQDCQVFVDTTVRIERLLTVSQALAQNAGQLSEMMVGGFLDRPGRDGSDVRPEFKGGV